MRSLVATVRGVDPATAFLLALIGVGWAGTAGAAAFPQRWLERSHLQHGFLVFAATQFVPFMYTAENSLTMTFIDAPPPEHAQACLARVEAVHNHVPLGALLMPQHRSALALCSADIEVDLRSSWGAASTSSRWRLRRAGRGYSVEPS